MHGDRLVGFNCRVSDCCCFCCFVVVVVVVVVVSVVAGRVQRHMTSPDFGADSAPRGQSAQARRD